MARPTERVWRLPLVAGFAWAGGLAAAGLWGAGLAVATTLAALWVWRCGVRAGALVLGVGLAVATVVAGSAGLRALAHEGSPVQELAQQRARAEVQVAIRGDPRRISDQRFLVPVTLLRLRSPRGAFGTHTDAVLWTPSSWPTLALGERWEMEVRLARRGSEVTMTPLGTPHRTSEAGWSWRTAAAVRSGVRRAVGSGPAPLPDTASALRSGAALVPALVDGDDGSLPQRVVEDFRRAGLTHLLAVSGTNLTIVLAFLLLAARGVGVRGRWLVPVGLVGVCGFVLVARGEPSVLRAAVMGTIGVLALGQRDRRRALAVLAASVVVLLLVAPGLATQAGFALSVGATAGILLLAPGWQELLTAALASSCLGRVDSRWWAWLPPAVAVPLAAQVACTPLVAGLSGEVSLVAVAANLAAAPAVGPVTVSGLLGGLVALLWEAAGQLVAAPAVWGASWIVLVADRASALPGAAVAWPASWLGLSLLCLLCLGCVVVVPWLLGRPGRAVASLAVAAALVLVPWPSPGWPPRGWVVAACDVGQGDALLLHAGPGTAVMVDVGPDPRAAQRCLRRFGIDRVPLLVLTHFDADHVAGLVGVLDRVDRVETAAVALPAPGAREVAAAAGSRAGVAVPGTRQVGEVTVQVLSVPTLATNPNDASVVLVARVHGAIVLLTGDLGRRAQQPVRRLLGTTSVDVLKVPHHGSKDTDLAWLRALAPAVALVSVGEENTYGHPAPEVLAALAGARLGRTDRDGDVAVVERDGQWVVLRS